MTRMGLERCVLLVVVSGIWAASAAAQSLTADRAVQLALRRSTQAIQAEASVLDSRGGLYSAMAGLLPSVSAGLNQVESRTKNETGFTQFAGNVIPVEPNDSEFSSKTPSHMTSSSVPNRSRRKTDPGPRSTTAPQRAASQT